MADECGKIENAIQAMIKAGLGQKTAVILFCLLMVSSVGYAQTTTTPAPTSTDVVTEIINTISPTEGVMYGVREHQIKDVTSFQIVGYKSAKYPLIAINANLLYSPADMIGGSITYPVGSFTSITGITTTIPILSWLSNMNVNVGYGLGWFTSGGTRSNDDGPILSGNIKF